MSDASASQRQRIDKWLFFTRIAKSRTLAQGWIEAGHVAVNGDKVRRPSADVKIGDRLEVATHDKHVIVVVKAPGDRRGPFEEARLLYSDETPPREKTSRYEQATREAGTGRPEKKERRQMERLKARYDFTE
ncbi:ribosome-associated heat shock protein Hsp15 [Rhizobium sp. SG_E_25_P2]|uniref:RNA-binding S4 domain-containing protein n=1 Tax=Rhizobium sp. SG_E_25_P2 TaxID=2879942 RepID=UPI0024770208|nr:RNA-binding S4 domain-containing protein [Rhizobium sp. SG_E_25_P2]MDH6267547.1 ribosome-associated heat shock protein Hsp15 [Rhizobium sp. SG_E_25_P2]